MKKWMIVAIVSMAALTLGIPMGMMIYHAFGEKPQPEDLAPETKPTVINK
jgi:hypothetical protein